LHEFPRERSALSQWLQYKKRQKYQWQFFSFVCSFFYILLCFYSVDNFIWALSQNILWQIDPFANAIISQITITQNAYALDFDRNTGFVYVTTDQSVEIFNSLGQLIQAIPNDNNQLSIDVSNLSTGTYFVKVHSDKGVGVSKFVKQ
jgi:hypothetical protein